MSQLECGRTLRRTMSWGMIGALIAMLVACSGGPAVTIQALIDEAAPGEIVAIPTGTYRENLTISKSIVLTGEVDDSRGVEIVGKGDDEAAIEITGDVEVSLRAIAITRSKGVGISTADSAHVTLENVQARGCASSGLSIREQSSVTGIDCEFSECDRNGITITGNGQLEASNCLLELNASAGLAAVTTGSISLSSSDIRSNGENGITLAGECSATMLDITVDENGGGPVTAGQFVTLATVFSVVLGTGISLSDQVSLILVDSDVTESERTGIVVFDQARIELRNCRVLSNGQHGVLAVCDGDVFLISSTVGSNAAIGIFVAGKSHFDLESCQVRLNTGGGVAVYSIGCFGLDVYSSPYRFSGPISGANNDITRPGEQEGNSEFGCCPDSLWEILCREVAPADDGS